MIFDLLIKEMVESLIGKLDKAITPEIAPAIIENIKTVHEHPILRNNNCFIVTKVDDDIKIIYCKSHELEFEKEPVQMSISKISEIIVKKCEAILKGDETPISIDLDDFKE